MAQRTLDTPEQQQVTEAILDVLRKIAGDMVGLSFRDLLLQLRARNLVVTKDKIRSAVSQLLDEGKIEKRPSAFDLGPSRDDPHGSA